MTTSLVPAASTDLAEQSTTVSGELGLAGRLTGSHYVLPPDTPIELWLHDGWVLQQMEKRVGFWLGDWLLAGEERYGERKYSQALQASGYAHQTLKNMCRVAGRFPAEQRVHEGLAFGHYDAAGGLPSADAHEILAEAAELKLSTKDVRERAKFRQQQLREAHLAALPRPRLERTDALLLVEDALALTLDDDTVDLIITSPPYALDVGYDSGGDIKPQTWFDFVCAFSQEAFRVARPGARFALNVPVDTTIPRPRPTAAQATVAALGAGWTYRSTIMWCDGELGKSTARGSFDAERHTGTASAPSILAPSEVIILLSKGPWWREEPPDRPSDIELDEWIDWTNGHWRFRGEVYPWEDHPAPFPLELPRRLVTLLSFPGDLVLDPFVGSGTTAVAALQGGRRFVGTDTSERYILAATRRLVSLGLAG